MKTLPSRFLAASAVPERPWWKNQNGELLRSDGKTVATIQEAIQVDYESPLPRPPYQVGQVWVLPQGEGSRTYTIVGRLEVNPKAAYWHIVGPYLPNQISDDHLCEYLVDAYLIYDPIGNKAPWAPWKLQ